MAAGSADLRDMMLEAGAAVQEVMAEFERKLVEPQIKTKFAQLWAQMPPEMREKFASERPQEYAAFMSMLKK